MISLNSLDYILSHSLFVSLSIPPPLSLSLSLDGPGTCSIVRYGHNICSKLNVKGSPLSKGNKIEGIEMVHL